MEGEDYEIAFKNTIFICLKWQKNDKEKFQALKLMKLIYQVVYLNPEIGKISRLEEVMSSAKALPCNIKHSVSKQTAAERAFEMLYFSVACRAKERALIESTCYNIHSEWERLIARFIGEVFDPQFLSKLLQPSPITSWMKPVAAILVEKTKRIDSTCVYVMDRAFLNLNITTVKSIIGRKRKIIWKDYNQSLLWDQKLASTLFLKLESTKADVITWEDYENIYKILSGKQTGLSLNELARLSAYLSFILSSYGPEDRTIRPKMKMLKQSFEYFRILAERIYKNHSLNLDKGFSPLFLISCIQAISIVNYQKEKYYDTINHIPQKKSLMATLRSQDSSESALLSWEFRVANRIMLFLGGKKAASSFQRTLLYLLKLEEDVFQGDSLWEIRVTHKEAYNRAINICNKYRIAIP